MSDPYMSQIEAFAFNFAPRGWMQCAGQTLAIQQYQALFSLLGTSYGGNGVTTFQLPDLRGRVAVGVGQAPGLSNYTVGQTGGYETVALSLAQMPAGPHTHTINANTATTGGTNAPGPSVVPSVGISQSGSVTVDIKLYGTVQPSIPMGTLAPAGGQPHNNLAPTLALNYCICVQGVFPSRT